MDRRTFIAASAALLGSTAASAKPPRLPRLAPADFRVVLADIAGAEGLATAPDGRIAYSTSDAAVGLAHPDGRRELIGPAKNARALGLQLADNLSPSPLPAPDGR